MALLSHQQLEMLNDKTNDNSKNNEFEHTCSKVFLPVSTL